VIIPSMASRVIGRHGNCIRMLLDIEKLMTSAEMGLVAETTDFENFMNNLKISTQPRPMATMNGPAFDG
jgi:hypothetical protein